MLFNSCVQLVFSMLCKDFTSELLKTSSLHLVGVLMLGKDFTSEFLHVAAPDYSGDCCSFDDPPLPLRKYHFFIGAVQKTR